MNWRNKYLLNTIRIILGIFFIFSGVSGLLVGHSMQGIPASMVDIMKSLWNSGIFQMIKVTEIIAGLMLTFNLLPALASIFLVPIGVGIIVFNAVISPEYLPVCILIDILIAYMGYAYWDKYKALFESDKAKTKRA